MPRYRTKLQSFVTYFTLLNDFHEKRGGEFRVGSDADAGRDSGHGRVGVRLERPPPGFTRRRPSLVIGSIGSYPSLTGAGSLPIGQIFPDPPDDFINMRQDKLRLVAATGDDVVRGKDRGPVGGKPRDDNRGMAVEVKIVF